MKAKSTEEKIEEFKQEHSKFFDERKLFHNLALAALYLAAFELLKSSIIHNLRSFFWGGEDVDIVKDQPKHYLEVLDSYFKKHKKRRDAEYQACCDWLMDEGVIDDDERRLLVEEIKDQRNDIAHELPKILLEPENKVDVSLLTKAQEILRKIDVWWILNVHVPTNPDYDGVTVTENDVNSSRSMFLGHVLQAFAKLSEEILSPGTQASS